MTELYDVIIIGGGPGGLTAGLYARRAALRTAMVEKGLHGGQVNFTEGVENYPGFESISGFDLSNRFLQHAKSYGLELVQQEVTAVEPDTECHKVLLANGEILQTHAVILATGGSPCKLNVLGEMEYYGRGVSYCATCDGFFYQDKTVVVVGGGNTALEEALYLAKLTKRVYLVHRRNAFRGSRILQERVISEPKIDILWSTIATSIIGSSNGVCGIYLKDTETGELRDLATDAVFIFIGFLPNNQLVPKSIKMDADGYVITDDKCETTIPGVFVVGDLRQKYAKQIITASADGCIAALAAAHFVEMKKAKKTVKYLHNY
ncbi:MAG: thioredoxin-disulfide reductase [Syntrophaceae bacterium]